MKFKPTLSAVIPEKLSFRPFFMGERKFNPESRLVFFFHRNQRKRDSGFHFLSSQGSRRENVSGMTAESAGLQITPHGAGE
jgi:hypothetical protein